MKNLESALRFGFPLLVQDVEHIDPVLNPVLNKEIHKTGGRILIKLGDQEIDFSPSFVIFLFTRDPTSHFTPDLCSRVTFVNFTVTPSSLQSQCLYEVLKVERPDIHKKRTDLIKLQGEFRVRLRNLEKALLNALNGVQGNILDDDKVISTLETLKKEAADVQQKVKETDVVIEEISQTSAVYNQLSLHCSRIYFALEAMAAVHFLYQFSLRYFLHIFHSVLHRNANLANVKDPISRLEVLIRDIFQVTYLRVARTLLNEDRLTFALRLAQLRLRDSDNELDDAEFDFLLKGGDQVQKAALSQLAALLPAKLQCYLQELVTVPAFAKLTEHMQTNGDAWRKFLETGSAAETLVPSTWEQLQAAETNKPRDVAKFFRRLVVLKGFRPDRLIAGASAFVSSVFGEHFLQLSELNLAEVRPRDSSHYGDCLSVSFVLSEWYRWSRRMCRATPR
jgi:dynein heavy chain 1